MARLAVFAAPQPPLPPHIPRFPLAANREHENGVDHSDIAIQGDVALRAATDHELIHFAWRGPTDQRIMFKDADRLDDFADACGAVVDFAKSKGSA